MRSEQQAEQAIERYADTVKRICMIHLNNYADTEDIFQTVFFKYALSSIEFESQEHERAWIIRVTLNACRDLLKNVFRSRTVPIQDLSDQAAAPVPEHQEVWQAVLALPPKYRDVVYLHYYEGYSAPEISRILKKNVNTIYTWLNRSKGMLQQALGGEGNG